MRSAFKFLMFLSLGLLTTGSFTFAVETVTLLDRGEPYASMVAQNGIFWIGQSRRQFNADYRIEVYSTDGRLIDRATLSHSISSLKERNDGTVVMTGINPSTQLTEYTFAKLLNNKIQKQTTSINVYGFISFWIGSLNNLHFFADIGGNSQDDNQNPNLPAQTIFSTRSSAPDYLSTRVRMPIAGTIHNDKLLLVSSEGMGSKAGSIVEVNPRTQQRRTLLETKNGHFWGFKIIPGTNDFVTSAIAQNKLIIADSATGQIRREISTQGYTRTFAITGHCLIAGNDEKNTIEIFDLKSSENKSVLNAEIGMPITEFSGIKQIAIDDTTGIVFALAALPCNPMVEVCDRDDNRVVSLGSELGNAIKNSCR